MGWQPRLDGISESAFRKIVARVGRRFVLTDLEVDVRAGGVTSRSEKCHDLVCFDFLAGPDLQLTVVPVQRRGFLIVPEDHDVAVARKLVARVNHLAGPSRVYGHPQLSSDVDALVVRSPSDLTKLRADDPRLERPPVAFRVDRDRKGLRWCRGRRLGWRLGGCAGSRRGGGGPDSNAPEHIAHGV